MTHASLVAHFGSNSSQYRELWEQRWEGTEEFGAFVFLPEKDLNWQWWTIQEIRRYIQDGGLEDEKMLDGIYDFEFGEEFLVLEIEYVDGPEQQEAYFHRINRVRMN